MTPEEVESKVKEIIQNKLQVEPEKIRPDARLDADLGADSLDLVDLAMALEENFHLDIPEEELENIRTVGDVVSYIQQKNAS